MQFRECLDLKCYIIFVYSVTLRQSFLLRIGENGIHRRVESLQSLRALRRKLPSISEMPRRATCREVVSPLLQLHTSGSHRAVAVAAADDSAHKRCFPNTAGRASDGFFCGLGASLYHNGR